MWLSSPDAELDRAGVDALAAAWIAAWTEGAGFATCCTAGVSYEDPLAPEPLVGLDRLEDQSAALRAAFPDAHGERTAAALAHAGHACIPWRLRGTQRGNLGPVLPATERPLDLHGVHYLELIDGRINRARGFYDLYDGCVQLGLLPARGGFGEAALLLLRGLGLRRRAG